VGDPGGLVGAPHVSAGGVWKFGMTAAVKPFIVRFPRLSVAERKASWVDVWTLGEVVERVLGRLRLLHEHGLFERGQLGGRQPSDDEFRDRFTVAISE
jgi:hypothetical protein